MLPRFSSHLLLCSAISLPTLARAAEEKPFGASDTPAEVRPISQREFADAATTQIEFLKELRAWRNTLRGNGAQRKWAFSPLGSEKLALSLGNVAPSAFGGGAGIAAGWKGLEIGSTAQPQAIDEALARFDSLLSGQDVKPQNPAQLNWFRARLSDAPRAQIEVMAARATRDFSVSSQSVSSQSVSSQKWRSGDFGSARAKFQLPAKWSLSGDFSRANVERADENDAANAWGVTASGPIAHPFGVANASASWRSVGDGYVAPTAENGANGAENGGVEVAQDLKIGPLSGNLRFGAATQRRAEAETVRAGEELAQNRARSAAQMRFALTPNLSFTGNGEWNGQAATRAMIDGDKVDDETAIEDVKPVQAREMSRQLAGDVGVQWNFSKALSLAASLGLSSQDSHSQIGDFSNLAAQSDELRRALEVRQKSGAGDFRVRFSQRARKNAVSTANLSQNAASDAANAGAANAGAPVSQWRVEAARPLFGGVRLKTILDFASDAATDQSARRIEAQLQLARAARLDARYREGNLAPGLMSDEWSSVFAASNSAPKQVSARFGVGSAASGAGLGLSLEMVRSQGALPDSYRVGLQFK